MLGIYAKIKAWFKNSETIFLARLQVFIGTVAGFLTVVDPQLIAPVLPSLWVPWFFLVHGLSLEYLRRRGDDRMK